MKTLVYALGALLFGMLSCGCHKSPDVGKRLPFQNVSSSGVIISVVPRYHPAEIIPGETMLDVP